MEGTLTGLVYLDHGDYGPEVTRADKSLVRFASFFDSDSQETLKLTLAPDWDGELPTAQFTPVELRVRGVVRNDAGITKDGRAYAKGGAVKLQVLGIKAGPVKPAPPRS